MKPQRSIRGDIAQLGERVGGIDEAGGSNPPISNLYFDLSKNLFPL